MAILYTWRLNCRKRQLSSDMHLPRDQVCEFKARHPLCWATASLTAQFCVRNQHMHLCNTGTRQESRRRVVMEGLLRWLHGRAQKHSRELAGVVPSWGHRGEHSWMGLIMTLPWSQLLQGTGSPCKPEPARTHNAGEAPPPSPKRGAPGLRKAEPLPPTQAGSMAPVCLRSWALTNVTLPRWWQQSVKPITLNYFYSWL